MSFRQRGGRGIAWQRETDLPAAPRSIGRGLLLGPQQHHGTGPPSAASGGRALPTRSAKTKALYVISGEPLSDDEESIGDLLDEQSEPAAPTTEEDDASCTTSDDDLLEREDLVALDREDEDDGEGSSDDDDSLPASPKPLFERMRAAAGTIDSENSLLVRHIQGGCEVVHSVASHFILLCRHPLEGSGAQPLL